VLLVNPAQESRILKVGYVAIGGSTNAEVKYRLYASRPDPQFLETRAHESHGRHIIFAQVFTEHQSLIPEFLCQGMRIRAKDVGVSVKGVYSGGVVIGLKLHSGSGGLPTDAALNSRERIGGEHRRQAPTSTSWLKNVLRSEPVELSSFQLI
jgi:hypothetical protein